MDTTYEAKFHQNSFVVSLNNKKEVMMSLFYLGVVPVFIGIITLLALCVFAMAIHIGFTYKTIKLVGNMPKKLKLIKEGGLLALMLGVFFTSLDLYGAFQAMSMASSISPFVLSTGLKVTMIPLLYGLIIYIITIIILMILTWKIRQSDLVR